MRLRRVPPERVAVISFALARTAFCGYRACVQSITVDEAFTYNSFVSGPWANLYSQYDANNHVLYSILAKLSLHGFGLSELTLRLPSVIAGFFLVLGIYWVLEQAVSSWIIRWIALLTLCLDPLILDFSVAARGYGLGLAFLVWSIYFFMRGRDATAGILVGLGISANLTIAFPAAGLILCPFALKKGDQERRLENSLTIAVPAAAVFAAICYPSLSTASADRFYVGTPDFRHSIYDLIFTCIRGTADRAGLFGTRAGAQAIQFFILPVLAVFSAVVSVVVFLREEARRLLLTPAFVLCAAIVELAAARHIVGLNYPIDRLGLYVVLLFGLAWAIAAAEFKSLPVRSVQGILACVLAVQFATQFKTRYFQLWQPDMPAKEVARKIAEDSRGRPPGSVNVSATWYQAPAIEFYRRYYRISALKPVERHEKTMLDGFDYYVLNLKDDEDVRKGNVSRLIPLFREPVSGVLLAKEPAHPR